MGITDRIDLLRLNAARFRELAEKASDQEVAESLLRLAQDIELAIKFFEDHTPPEA